MKVIIIEGTDNVGKDTVIEQLSYEFTDTTIHHCEKPKSSKPEKAAQQQKDLFIKLMGNTVYFAKENENKESICLIHNRSWYGEYVYGCMYRDNNPEQVKQMINMLEKCLTAVIKPEDLCFITLLSDNADFLVRNDDGLSISNADKGKIIHETQRFEEIYKESIIKNKHIVYVNDGDNFRPKEDIFNEILEYIYHYNAEPVSNKKEQISIENITDLLNKYKLTEQQYNEIKNAEEITDSIYKQYTHPNGNLTIEQLFNIHNNEDTNI